MKKFFGNNAKGVEKKKKQEIKKVIEQERWILLEKSEYFNVYIRDEGLSFRHKTIRIEYKGDGKDPCEIYRMIEKIIDGYNNEGVMSTVTIENNIFIKLRI